MAHHDITIARQRLEAKAEFYQRQLDNMPAFTPIPHPEGGYSQFDFQMMSERSFLISEAYKLRHAITHLETNPGIAFAILDREDKINADLRAENEKREKQEQEKRRKIKRENDVQTKAQQAIDLCNSTIFSCKEDKDFAQQLSHYLQKRKNKSALFVSADNNVDEIERRSDFTLKLIPLVKSVDSLKQIALLREEDIIIFKGRCTQQLYQLLVMRRNKLIDKQKLNFEEKWPSLQASCSEGAIELNTLKPRIEL